MGFTPRKIQRDTHKLISQTPDGYRSRDRIIAKINEEKTEIYEAMKEYKETPRKKNLNNLRKEFGDLLRAVCCLTNSYGKIGIGKKEQWNISLDEAYTARENTYQDREIRKANLDMSVKMLEKTLTNEPENVDAVKVRIGALLFAIVDFVPVCCENDMINIDLDHAFVLTLNKNKKRVKTGKKEAK